ncbi:putative peptide modification system cyclase [Stenotrophomonas cyclobalanopsidis]|uniref:putative peptide modification system cyclase n=1 Tax=Stenotrophomonas cyclobalanopsidis TaxID=2771362 RepID=UPI003460B925
MNGDTGTSSTHSPQLRALLFTDFCDSLTLVERIGDSAAAELFQDHDRLVLRLQQAWNGRLIDRSDGLFLLFERPIDALGFALDYQSELAVLGTARNVSVRARAGLNVGEVILWNNSAEAVAHGAKPIEVEGLAKPMAARLMQLAGPGQILVSASAESTVRRSAGELGTRGQSLQWKSHGRWRFKGIASEQEVFEVGVPGEAEFRRPRSHGKARRSIAWWRRPLPMAMNAVALLVVAFIGWSLMRPAPAIAFAEREWIVLADVQNLSGNMLLNDGFEQAFRISLEQSRYVNVLSNIKVQDTLERMRQERGLLDTQAAVEVALREGARAVVVPRVEELHGRLRVTAQLIDPTTGKVVWTTHAEQRGMESLFASTDAVTVALRNELGEAIQQVSQTSLPLPQVATSDLDALHAYAIGLQAYGDGHYNEALRFFEQASRFDPLFAFAYLAQMRVYVARGDLDNARRMLSRAGGIRARLPGRDRLYLDAWRTELEDGRLEEVSAKWKLLADLYPDYHGAHANYAWAMQTLGRYPESEASARKAAAAANPLQSIAWQDVGRAQLAQNNYAGALESYRVSARLGRWTSNRHLVAATAASGDLAGAQRMIDAEPDRGFGNGLEGVAVAIDAGDTARAAAANRRALQGCGENVLACQMFELQALLLATESGRPANASAFDRVTRGLLARVKATKGQDRAEWMFLAAAAAYGAQRADHVQVADDLLPALRELADSVDDLRSRQMVTLVEANADRLQGHAAEALARLQPLLDGTELFQARVVRWQTLAAEHDPGELEARQWLLANAGRAYAESAGSYVMQLVNTSELRQARTWASTQQNASLTVPAGAAAARQSRH